MIGYQAGNRFSSFSYDDIAAVLYGLDQSGQLRFRFRDIAYRDTPIVADQTRSCPTDDVADQTRSCPTDNDDVNRDRQNKSGSK